jgi:protein FRG1
MRKRFSQVKIEKRRESIVLLNKKNTKQHKLETKVNFVCEKKTKTWFNDYFLVWVRADNLEDLVGPLFITHPSEPPVCLTVDDDDRFLAYPLPDLDESSAEPTIMQQVFVGSRIVGTTDSYSLKSANGKYLSSDKFGVVSCDSEAIGGQEEWKMAVTEAGIAFQNIHGKFLMIDEIAGGGVRIRADADDVGFCESFRVYCQSRFKYKVKAKKKASDASGTEIDNV